MRRPRESVLVRRPVQVECIPDGTPFELPPGTLAEITQALGSNFTLHVDGQLVRLKGADADAIGKPVPAPAAAAADAGTDLQSRIWATLKTCYDPEIPVDIVELGLIYGCELSAMPDGRTKVAIQLTLTAPGCGMGEAVGNEVAEKVLALDGVGEVTVDLVFDPPWDRSRMSETALLTLGL
ncbi:putative Fe-S cluster assembly protein SufT [Ramlibacter sp.]|uniref:putative Fe-S cluster assembly protein SufT n=1 Tax=Ramlibacter sp. TaxID=1917967 RepID=UPI002BF5DD3D|nr:putative Fe-S cluster assembly protein SufT [Ramlibacter sp.]HWI83102.1 putative Fe-S cluster assembly protein SufT [Ramlibacter sp.]